MDWTRLLSSNRVGSSGERLSAATDIRNPFESDVDRIVFASCFRRLSRKTQVYPFSKNDHVHTRLTHSLEVAQVGRTLGRCLARRLGDRIPVDDAESSIGAIVQAACLAHDLGNPPFGHIGEEAISHWFAAHGDELLKGLEPNELHDLRRFEGNAQGFRMLTQTESNLFCGGLRLTSATLGAFAKYPKSSLAVHGAAKFGVFISEEGILGEMARDLGLVGRSANEWCRHPLAYLTEAADDICYATIDLEDAVEAGCISPTRAYGLLLEALEDGLRDKVRGRLSAVDAYRVNFARIRGPVFDALIAGAVESFENNYDKILAGEPCSELLMALPDGDPRRTLIMSAKQLAKKEIYATRSMSELELGAFSTLECLLDAFCTAANECHKQLKDKRYVMNWKSVLVLRQLGNHSPCRRDGEGATVEWTRHGCFRRVLDYVSGMTDNYARDLGEQIRGVARS